jgi:hypothetical protein
MSENILNQILAEIWDSDFSSSADVRTHEEEALDNILKDLEELEDLDADDTEEMASP